MIRVGHIFDWGKAVAGHRKWAHLWSDTGDRRELDAFAAGIGLKLEWIQRDDEIKNPRYAELRYHYDVVPTKQTAAIQAGAVLTDELAYWRNKAEQDAATPKDAGEEVT